jgi:hypothetical protein
MARGDKGWSIARTFMWTVTCLGVLATVIVVSVYFAGTWDVAHLEENGALCEDGNPCTKDFVDDDGTCRHYDMDAGSKCTSACYTCGTACACVPGTPPLCAGTTCRGTCVHNADCVTLISTTATGANYTGICQDTECVYTVVAVRPDWKNIGSNSTIVYNTQQPIYQAACWDVLQEPSYYTCMDLSIPIINAYTYNCLFSFACSG